MLDDDDQTFGEGQNTSGNTGTAGFGDGLFCKTTQARNESIFQQEQE